MWNIRIRKLFIALEILEIFQQFSLCFICEEKLNTDFSFVCYLKKDWMRKILFYLKWFTGTSRWWICRYLEIFIGNLQSKGAYLKNAVINILPIDSPWYPKQVKSSIYSSMCKYFIFTPTMKMVEKILLKWFH